ncbi:hypothetical protein [Glaciecola sp. MF2-115]|uniref:hypothetical protein n=1 Tax=Glaciecola sp. MF2-115 TaxID=3384827 RepID=UPI0039A38754
MKKTLYTVLIFTFILILIPSIIETFSDFFSSRQQTTDKSEIIKEIIVVHKEIGHDASNKQWDTITSAVNYLTEQGIKNNQFTYLGQKFQLSKLYEKDAREIICSGDDPNNRLQNVIAILGPITSSCALEMINNYEVEIPVISSFATLPSINTIGRKFFHRTVPGDNFRIDKLIQLWRQDATRNIRNRDLIIYESGNIYSSDSFTEVHNEVSKLHTVHFIDVSSSNADTYDSAQRYESIFVMANQADPKILNAIKRVKKEQYYNHGEHRPKFFAKTEYADSLLFDSPGSIVAMTPSLLSYNNTDSSTFLDIERKNLSQRSASSFLAFEALYTAIARTIRLDSNCNTENAIQLFRCGIIEHLKTPYNSNLIGNKIEFIATTGDIDMKFLVKAEIRAFGTQFKYAPPDQSLPSLVTINYKKQNKGVWLGDPVEIYVESTKNTPFLVNFRYSAPNWIPNGKFKRILESLFSFDHTFEVSEKEYSFHPRFIGAYTVEVAKLGPDLRQSAGKHVVNIVPPKGLFLMILLSLLVAAVVSFITPPVNQRLNKTRLILEVIGAALFLYFITVTLRGFNLPAAPTLSFSNEPVTNLVYCAIIAGTVRLKIFAYFINPIIKRFTPQSESAELPNKEA